MNTNVTDAGDLRKYRTEIPNLIDDMELSVYAFRLYVHFKRVAGDGGKCWQSTRTIAEHCKMSVGMVSKAKRELEDAGLITVDREGWKADNLEIVDIWPTNFATYASCSPHEQSVHDTNTLSSPDERDCSPHERDCSPHEPKNKPIKKKPKKNKPREEDPPASAGRVITPWMEFIGALCWVCYGHDKVSALTKEQKGSLTSEAKRITDLEFGIDDLRIWYTDVWRTGWKYKNDQNARPLPSHVRSSLPSIRANTPNGFSDGNQQSDTSRMVDHVADLIRAHQEVSQHEY